MGDIPPNGIRADVTVPEQAIQTAARAFLAESLFTTEHGCLRAAEVMLQALADDGWHLTRTDQQHVAVPRAGETTVRLMPGERVIPAIEIVNTCGATLQGDGELPTLTCHLAHGHDGPHLDRDGSRWEDGDG